VPKVKLEWEDSGWYQEDGEWRRDFGIFHISISEVSHRKGKKCRFAEKIGIGEAFIHGGDRFELCVHQEYRTEEDMKTDIDDFVEKLKKPHLEIALKALG
jgi:hypothetical protein